MPIATTITISATSPAAATGAGGGAGTSATVVDALGNAITGDYLHGFESMQVTAKLQGAVGGTLDVYLQVTFDGVLWVDYAHYTQLTAANAAVKYGSSHSRSKGQALAVLPVVALTANTAVDGEWGVQARLWFVAGSGTSAGAVQTVVLHMESLR